MANLDVAKCESGFRPAASATATAATVQGLFADIIYPRIPSHEVIGTIDTIGPDVDGWNVGDRVGVGWFSKSCGFCVNCRHGNTFACSNIPGASGVNRDGGYATHMLAHASALASIPASLDAMNSARLLCTGITTFNAIRNCGRNRARSS